MKRIVKKSLSALLCLIMLMEVLPFHAFAVETYSGWCGDNAKWSYNPDSNTLTISGKGKAVADAEDDKYLWKDIETDLKNDEKKSGKTAKITLIVKKGITSIDIDDNFVYKKIQFPNSLKTIEGFDQSMGPSTFPIPKSVSSIKCHPIVSAFDVDKSNKYYSSKDGVLFNKNKSVLIQYPPLRKNKSYTIPATVNTIKRDSFDPYYLKKITFPKNVKKIENDLFWFCNLQMYFKGDPPKMSDIFEEDLFDEEYINGVVVYYPKKKKKKWSKQIKTWEKIYGGLDGLVKFKTWNG